VPRISRHMERGVKKGWKKRCEKTRWLLQMEQGQVSNMMGHYWINRRHYGLLDFEDKSKD